MRRAGPIWIAIVLLTCGLCARGQSHIGESAESLRLRTIYLKINGPEETSAQLRNAFEKVAATKGLLLTDDPGKANSSIRITLKEKPATERTLSATLISATLTFRDGQSGTVYSCKSVADGKGLSTSTHRMGRTALIPPNATTKTVFVEEPRHHKSAPLVESVKTEIGEAGFQVTTVEKDADASLTNITQLKARVPVKSAETAVDTKITSTGGMDVTSVNSLRHYDLIGEPIAAEAEGCRSTLQSLSTNSGYDQVIAAQDIMLASRTLR